VVAALPGWLKNALRPGGSHQFTVAGTIHTKMRWRHLATPRSGRSSSAPPSCFTPRRPDRGSSTGASHTPNGLDSGKPPPQRSRVLHAACGRDWGLERGHKLPTL
jgi:hypothetical protein